MESVNPEIIQGRQLELGTNLGYSISGTCILDICGRHYKYTDYMVQKLQC